MHTSSFIPPPCGAIIPKRRVLYTLVAIAACFVLNCTDSSGQYALPGMDGLSRDGKVLESFDLGAIQLSKTIIPCSFTITSDSLHASDVLPQNWTSSLVDSRFILSAEDQAVAKLPNGSTVVLEIDQSGDFVAPGGWLAKIKDNKVLLTNSKTREKFEFADGKINRWKPNEIDDVKWFWTDDGLQKIEMAGNGKLMLLSIVRNGTDCVMKLTKDGNIQSTVTYSKVPNVVAGLIDSQLEGVHSIETERGRCRIDKNQVGDIVDITINNGTHSPGRSLCWDADTGLANKIGTNKILVRRGGFEGQVMMPEIEKIGSEGKIERLQNAQTKSGGLTREYLPGGKIRNIWRIGGGIDSIRRITICNMDGSNDVIEYWAKFDSKGNVIRDYRNGILRVKTGDGFVMTDQLGKTWTYSVNGAK